MTNRRIEMYEYRQIVYRLKAGQSVRCISQETAFGRNKIQEIKKIATTHGWLSDKLLPEEALLAEIIGKHQPPPASKSQATPYSALIKEWSEANIQATVIHQHLKSEYGFSGSYNIVQRLVKHYKAAQGPKMTVPLIFSPGEAAQVDFGKGPKLFDQRIGKEVDTWFFVMTLCWSRHQYVELVTHQDIETWLGCHQNAFEWFGGVVKKVIIDNPKCAITKACYHDPCVQRSYEVLAQEYGFLISACPPRDPQKKGRVESGVKYVKRNFLPLKQFRSLQDANEQLKTWVLGPAGNRVHGSVFEKPLSRFESIERTQLLPLPVNRPDIGVWQKVSLYKDCHIRYSKCRYSAPHTLYDQPLWVKVTSKMVSIFHEHEEVAIHPRLFKPGEVQTKIEHLPPAAQNYFNQDADWCVTQSKKVGAHCHTVIETLLTDPVRDLHRQAQSVLKLQKKYGSRRLDLACQRAISFHAINYKTIKTILKEGVDYEALATTDVFKHLNKVYQGHALYQRDLSATNH